MAGNYHVVMEGDGEVVAEFTARSKDLPLKIRRLLTELGMYTEFAAKGFVNHRTANLAQNIHFEGVTEEGKGNFHAVVGVRKTAPYARWVEEGTGLYSAAPHWIFPKQGNFMAWEERGSFATPYAGRYVTHYKLISKSAAFLIVAHRVRGQKGQHYMKRAFEAMEETYLPGRLAALSEAI